MATSKPISKSEITSAQAKDPDRCRRMNVQMVQNILLIWLDNNIDENNSDCRNSITQLRRVVNTITTFIDGEECIEFLNNIEDEKACIIISGSFGQRIVPQIHNMSQVDTIFIFCGNKKFHQQWAKDWSKIKGVFTEIGPICEALKVTAQQCEQNATPMSFMTTTGDISKKNLNQLDPTFMYTQILKEILLSINFEQQHIIQFIQHCRTVFENNKKALQTVNELEKYKNHTPIWWYTSDSFLYPMLNRALRVLDGDIIIKLGFFISDLHRDIDKLHKEQFGGRSSNKTLTLYRGQGMNNDDFNKMKETKGGLLSFNCFLSTSKNRTISLEFANEALGKADLTGILFVMDVDPQQSTTPFASVADVGYFKDNEEEVLFSMHTVFRIGETTPMDKNQQLFQVHLTLTNDNDKDLCVLKDRIREEAEGSTGWNQLGELLIKMGQPAKAQQVYEFLLKEVTDEIEKARFYHQLGMAKYYLGEHKEALKFYEDALKIRQKLLPSSHLDIAKTYNWIGNTYGNMGDYTKELSFHEKALEIRKQSLPSNHPDLAKSYSNISAVYYNMSEYAKALSSHEKALEIQKQSLPSNHPDLASSYNNIGLVYSDTGEYAKALSSHEKALEIRKQSLPSNHPDLAKSYSNISAVYYNMGEYAKALSSHEKALEIQKQSLPSNHPDLASSYNNIGLVYSDTGEYAKALSSHEKALEIRKQSLPSNHPDLASSYNNIGLVYENMCNYSKARSYYERAIEIGKQSLPADHPSLKIYKNNLDIVKKKL